MAFEVAIVEGNLTVLDSLSVVLTPGDQRRGWLRRWQEAQRDLQDILSPQLAPLSGDAIHAAGQRLQAFYVQTYHLKDALKNEAGTTGIPPSDVENVVNLEPALALLADLANLDKHGKLNNSPRSGYVPSITSLAGDTANQVPGAWRLSLSIAHGERFLDGLQVAQDSVDGWRHALSGWDLI